MELLIAIIFVCALLFFVFGFSRHEDGRIFRNPLSSHVKADALGKGIKKATRYLPWKQFGNLKTITIPVKQYGLFLLRTGKWKQNGIKSKKLCK